MAIINEKQADINHSELLLVIIRARRFLIDQIIPEYEQGLDESRPVFKSCQAKIDVLTLLGRILLKSIASASN